MTVPDAHGGDAHDAEAHDGDAHDCDAPDANAHDGDAHTEGAHDADPELARRGFVHGAVPGITQEAGTVRSNEPAGVYRHLVIDAPQIAETARPGHFVAVAVGDSGLLLRRAFSLHRADPAVGTVEIVVFEHAPGTEWIGARRPGQQLDLVGPAGVPFAPVDGPAVLVGGGYGAAPLGWLADRLRHRGFRAEIIVGAATADRLFGQDLPDAGPLGGTHVFTEDGSEGTRGRVTDRLPELITASGAELVYACGPMGMLRAVHHVAEAQGVASQLAVEESMACGVGVCMTCVLPVIDTEGVTRMTRACVEGPVFAGAALRWDAIHTVGSAVPDDCLGAPTHATITTSPPGRDGVGAVGSMESGTDA